MKDRDGNDTSFQVGFATPPRIGCIKVTPISDTQPEIFDCVCDVAGYYNRPINGVRVPATINVELPCSVVVRGPAGTEILVEAWILDSFNSRGACASFVGAQSDIPVPVWASAFDLSGVNGVVTFKNNSGVVVGEALAPVINFSIPSGSATAQLVGTGNITLVFRQES